MRRVVAYALLFAVWAIAIDSAGHAVWNWAKLGSFGYHVPWTLLAIVLLGGVISGLLLKVGKHVQIALGLGPVILLLLVRHY